MIKQQSYLEKEIKLLEEAKKQGYGKGFGTVCNSAR
jgi:hypothetical protein